MEEVYVKCIKCNCRYKTKGIIKDNIFLSQCPRCLLIDGQERGAGIIGYAEKEHFKLFAKSEDEG